MSQFPKGTPTEVKLEAYSFPVTECGCFIWMRGLNEDGYGSISHNGKSQLAHRVAWELRNGPIPEGLHVCHSCDVPACVNPDHLWLGTAKENRADAVRKGRHKFQRMVGVNHPMAILTEDDVRAIRASTEKQKILAERYGVDQPRISAIKTRVSWRHVR